ncbi:gluconate 2-dehydrogenase subunit 3 family protein [Chelatococcus sp. GCM10030263]|uniref:gluconate 2-dehydrogenase subunit 3 family protein n=1 Tax=Chelatococcus sp. GCM10030263 TaxID=3273387 RepID=UPI0036171E5F
MTDLSRRNLLKAGAASVAGVGAVVATMPGGREAGAGALAQDAHVSQPHDQTQGRTSEATGVLFFFNDQEAAFIRAAVDRLIPPDPAWPGGAEADVLTYIDRQLAGAYGAGERMYLNGPWLADAPPQQGYQLRFTPAQLYQIGIEETRKHVRDTNNGREFWELTDTGMDAVLTGLENGGITLPSLPAPVFFETLLANTVEGFFADPAYGGNRDMAGWRMVGFPGAYAQYLDLVDVYGYAYSRPPIGMANDAARRAHIAGHR